MKQIQVRKVPYGETFSVFGDKFVALDYINGNVLAIRKEIWRPPPILIPRGVNDLGRPALTGHLVDISRLCKQGASDDTIPMNCDRPQGHGRLQGVGTFANEGRS